MHEIKSPRNRTLKGPPALLHSMFDQEGRRIDQAVINRLARIAGKSFRPHPLDAAGVLIRARLPGEDKLPGLDCTNGWGDLFTRGLEIIQTTGDHASILTDKSNRAGLALHLNGVLDRGNYSLVAAGEPEHQRRVQLSSSI